jgi:hypothetical protein
MAEHEQAMTTNLHVDKHGCVDEGVNNVMYVLVFMEHPLAIIPRERVTGDERGEKVIRAELNMS